MSAALPQDTALEAVEDLETLTKEATSKTPTGWWRLSIEGLKRAAITAGDIGKPVLELAAALVPLLTGRA